MAEYPGNGHLGQGLAALLGDGVQLLGLPDIFVGDLLCFQEDGGFRSPGVSGNTV